MSKQLHEKPYKLKVFKKGTGRPVMVLHGQVSTHRYMKDVTKRIAGNRTVYAFDLLGFGRSPRPKKAAYTVDQHITSIHKTILAVHAEVPFVLVGHSMGAQLALAYAKKYPAMVSSLVLTGLPLFDSKDTAYEQLTALNPKNAWLLRGRRARLLGSMPGVVKPLMACIALVFGKGDYPARVVIDVVRNNWQSFSRSLEEVVLGYNPYPDIQTAQANIYFIFGDKDPISIDAVQKLKLHTRKKQQVTMVQGTHQVPLEHPKVIADTVLSL